MNQTVTMVEGVRVGHSSSFQNRTGTTVVLFDSPAITAVDARGGWPGTFDTDSIRPAKTFYRKNAIFLTGGDVFGLICAAGIQKYLLRRKMASGSESGFLPAVVGANIYDLEFGRNISKVNYARLGYRACLNASSDPVKQGNYGAGVGATVGKLNGIKFAMKGGIGSSATKIPRSQIKIGAIVVTNSVGNVYDDRGITIAGTRSENYSNQRRFLEMEDLAPTILSPTKAKIDRAKATTIGVVVTDLDLTHEECLKVVEMTHDGLARCIRPSHATTDGDTLFCASTGSLKIKTTHDIIDLVGHYASVQVSKSVISAVRNSKPMNGLS